STDTVFCLSSRRRQTTTKRDWSSDVCSSDLGVTPKLFYQFVSHETQSCQRLVRVSPERLGDRPPHASIHLVSIHISVNQRRILLVNVLIPISRHNGSNVPVLLNQDREEFLQSAATLNHVLHVKGRPKSV